MKRKGIKKLIILVAEKDFGSIIRWLKHHHDISQNKSQVKESIKFSLFNQLLYFK